MTCICNYKYDLEEFAEETEEAEESKEKNIFDVNGVTKLQSDQTLSSVVAEWWETFESLKVKHMKLIKFTRYFINWDLYQINLLQAKIMLSLQIF